jgi:hypothetical protein
LQQSGMEKAPSEFSESAVPAMAAERMVIPEGAEIEGLPPRGNLLIAASAGDRKSTPRLVKNYMFFGCQSAS